MLPCRHTTLNLVESNWRIKKDGIAAVSVDADALQLHTNWRWNVNLVVQSLRLGNQPVVTVAAAISTKTEENTNEVSNSMINSIKALQRMLCNIAVSSNCRDGIQGVGRQQATATQGPQDIESNVCLQMVSCGSRCPSKNFECDRLC